MGEHIKDLKKISYRNNEIIIELNGGNISEQGNDIHIEMSPFRLELSDEEFMKIAVAMIEAKIKLKYKENKEV